jgi:hypothetical protein
MLGGWLVLAFLTVLAGLDAIGLAVRARLSGRAELAIAASAAFFGLLDFPVLLLGYTNLLTARNLALASAAVLGFTLAILLRGRSPRDFFGECGRAALAVLGMPYAALVEAARARSVVFVGIAWAGSVTALAFFVTLVYPSLSWDSLLYHEPIVGFAIQNHGFSVVSLPMNDTAQAVNGYPKLGESLSIWLTIFTDRTLVELPNVLAAPAMMLGVFALARRYGDRLSAMGWAAVALLMPQTWAQLCQVYIDIEVGFFAIAAIYFATRPDYRVTDSLWATLAMALLMGCKHSALVMVPPIAFVAYLRLLYGYVRARPAATLGVIAFGSLIVAVIGVIPLWRNWISFHNPVWPVDYESHLLGARWHGLKSLSGIVADGPLKEIIDSAYAPPASGFRDVIDRGYGYAIAWIVVPVGLFALLVAAAVALLELVGLRARSSASNLGWVLIPIVIGFLTTPTLSGRNARYNIHLVAGLMAAISWLFARSTWARAREGLVAASIALSIVPIFWQDGFVWTWGATKDPWKVFTAPLGQRRVLTDSTFDLVAAQRSAEIHAGDRVLFDEGCIFMGPLWNFEFSNEAHMISSKTQGDLMSAIASYDPKWVVITNPQAKSWLEVTGRWQLIGRLVAVSDPVVYRRRPR